jgi:hypothetical protein
VFRGKPYGRRHYNKEQGEEPRIAGRDSYTIRPDRIVTHSESRFIQRVSGVIDVGKIKIHKSVSNRLGREVLNKFGQLVRGDTTVLNQRLELFGRGRLRELVKSRSARRDSVVLELLEDGGNAHAA